MEFRTVYTVADDPHRWPITFGGAAFALVWAAVWFAIHRWLAPRAGHTQTWRRTVGPPVVAVVIGGLLFAAGLPEYRDRRDAVARLRSGDFDTLTGPVQQVRVEPGKTRWVHLWVAGREFVYHWNMHRAGFRGEYTDPPDGHGPTAGTVVRVGHHDGRILQLDIAAGR